jgi:hypothetical protein
MDFLKDILTGVNWQAIALKAAVVLIVLGATFGLGYRSGENSVVKPYATATVNAATQGAHAQSDKTAKDAKANHQDAQERGDKNKKRDAAVAAIKKSEPAMLPQPQTGNTVVCPPVSADAMKKLNDPDIIGEDAQ